MNPSIFFIVALAIGVIAFWVVVGINTKKRGRTRKNSSVGIRDDKAVEKLLKAAEAGDAEAQFKLAQTYQFKESGKYIYWLEKSAEQDYDEAIRELANEFDYGNKEAQPPIKADRKKALEYFTRLADKGDIEAMKRISLIYYVAFRDEANGREWVEKAASAGDVESMVELGNDYRFISEIADFDKSEYWYKKAADSGSGKAMKGLGDLYNYNEEHHDYFKAESWYKKAVAAGEYFAYVRLGDMCKEGKGFAKDYAAAFEYYKKAADNGDEYGKISMAEAYQNGEGVERDEKKAFELLKEAAQETVFAKYPLGLCYFNGTGVEQDYNRAVQLFKECPKIDVNASNRLGECYYFGYGVEADKEKAHALWSEFASYGDKEAKEYLKTYFGEKEEN